MLDGDHTSSNWRAMKSARSALFGDMPRTSRVALFHHALLREKGLLPPGIRWLLPGWVGKASIARLRREGQLGMVGGAVCDEARKLRAGVDGLYSELEQAPRRMGQMRGPVEPGGIQRVG